MGLVWLVPVLVPGEAQGTISYRAEVHTELIIISFQNTLSLAPPLQAASATRAFTNSKIATQQQRRGSVFQTNSIRTLCTFPLILHDPHGSWRAQVLLWDLLAPPLWISACSLHTHTPRHLPTHLHIRTSCTGNSRPLCPVPDWESVTVFMERAVVGQRNGLDKTDPESGGSDC